MKYILLVGILTANVFTNDNIVIPGHLAWTDKRSLLHTAKLSPFFFTSRCLFLSPDCFTGPFLLRSFS